MCICLRIYILYNYIFIQLPQTYKLCLYTYHFNQTNSWQNPKNEPFLTNCSLFNAFICWYFYIALITIIYVILHTIPILIMVLIFKIVFYNLLSRNNCLNFSTFVYKGLLSFILGNV